MTSGIINCQILDKKIIRYDIFALAFAKLGSIHFLYPFCDFCKKIKLRQSSVKTPQLGQDSSPIEMIETENINKNSALALFKEWLKINPIITYDS